MKQKRIFIYGAIIACALTLATYSIKSVVPDNPPSPQMGNTNPLVYSEQVMGRPKPGYYTGFPLPVTFHLQEDPEPGTFLPWILVLNFFIYYLIILILLKLFSKIHEN